MVPMASASGGLVPPSREGYDGSVFGSENAKWDFGKLQSFRILAIWFVPALAFLSRPWRDWRFAIVADMHPGGQRPA